MCNVGQEKKKGYTPIYFNTNYRTEMKLVPIIMDYYCLLQFDALKFLLHEFLQYFLKRKKFRTFQLKSIPVSMTNPKWI